jgi:hypothetical protein
MFDLKVFLFRRMYFPLLLLALSVGHTIMTGGSFSALFAKVPWDRMLMPYRESITRVVDLPDVEQLRIPNSGRYYDLGYHHTYKGGAWVGRIDSRTYVEMTPSLKATMLRLGHLNAFPPVPEASLLTSFGRPFWIAVAVITALLVMWASKLVALFVRPPKDEMAYIPEHVFQQSMSEGPPPNFTDGPRTFGKRS